MGDLTARFERLARLFESALQFDQQVQREEFLQTACTDDPSLEGELRRLLESDTQVMARASGESVPRLPRVGSYQTRELIGSGGMGAVYRATREDDVTQEVAIKVIGAAFWPAAVESRFRRERQILAGLEHPNIARFLDAGRTADGSPYMVMELVEGEHLDRWCDRAQPTVRERLEMFLRICEAVAFAHRKLIVHRDLKPQNILVTAMAGPKLLDFGIARTIGGAEGGSLNTQTAGLLFTPLYASPEQLRGETASVSCDVYSLGMLLFVLLAEKHPFGGYDATPAEIAAHVLSAEPPLASTLTADVRVRRQLRGDLDAVIQKAVARDVRERYASVEQLAADIRLYLDGYPVQAAPKHALYRIGKFLRRHKTGTVVAGALTLSIAAGLIATLWQARLAREQHAAAERRFAVARDLGHYLVFDLPSSLESVPSSTPVRAEMIDHSLNYLDRLAAERTADPALRTELGHGYYVLADVLGTPFRPNLGKVVAASGLYRKAIAMLEPVTRQEPDNVQAQIYLAQSRGALGRSLEFGGISEEGHRLLEQAARDADVLGRRWPEDFQAQLAAAIIENWWARSLATRTGFFVTAAGSAPALEAAHRAVDHAEAALRLHPGQVNALRAASNAYGLIGYITATSDQSAASPYFRRALETLDRMPAPQSSTITRQARANALLALGKNCGHLGQYPAALQSLREAQLILSTLAAADAQNAQARLEQVVATSSLADVEQQAGESAPARVHYLEAVNSMDGLIAQSPQNRNFLLQRADFEHKAASLCARVGKTAQAEELEAKAIVFYKAAIARPDASPVELTLAAQDLMETEVRHLRDAKLALALMLRASQMMANDSFVQEQLAEAYWLNGDPKGAVRAIQQAQSLLGGGSTPEKAEVVKLEKKYERAQEGITTLSNETAGRWRRSRTAHERLGLTGRQ